MKAVIIEDEVLIADEMKATITSIAPDISIVATLPSIAASVNWFRSNPQPDFMFMDIKLSDGLSFELFEHIQVSCPIIFCTAYEEYAIRAFKVNGVDYLLKPVQEEDLEKAIEKIRQLKSSKQVMATDMQACWNILCSLATRKGNIKSGLW